MAPAAASNWLSFSLSPMEMLASSHQQHQHQHQQTSQILPVSSSHHYYLDPFYSNDWVNPKSPTGMMYGDYVVEQSLATTTSTMVPKLENFLGVDTNASYNTHTETTTQDSSSQLSHLYDPNPNPTHNYFSHPNLNPNPHHYIKAMTTTGYPTTFSANSGSEVDDSSSIVAANHLGGCDFMGQSIESSLTQTHNHTQTLTGLGGPTQTQTGSGGNLSLAVISQTPEKAIVPVTTVNDSDNVKKISDTFGQRTSIYRGVTRHRWTGRYEAHLWDNSCRREGQARKGRQVYLGGYDKEDKAARSYDLAALKYWGPTATTNFPISNYTKELDDMKHATKQEFIASLRRKSSGFSRGASIYRGVTRHHQQGRWQARIGRVAGNKDLYLGTFATEEEAAEAYDIAAIKFRGMNAVTNFEMNRYDVEAILKSNLPIGGAAKRLKLATEASSTDQKPGLSLDQQSHSQSSNTSSGAGAVSTINFGAIQVASPISYDAASAIYHQNLMHHFSSNGGGTQGVVSSDLPYGAPMSLMPQTPSEFYIWPHQSY